jgi:pimeloyl-ACP methyl ester carboxylesterase
MKHSRYLRLAPTLLLCVVIAGCSTVPKTMIEAVQGRQVEMLVSRKSGPTVVFETGLDGTMEWWSKVWPEVSMESNALAYNRPGYGRSEATEQPRDGAHIVDELRALLRAKQMPPPYVLVGHSIGGLYMQLYARLHPDEVMALVLVDSTHPEQLRGKGAQEHWPALLKLAFGVATSATAKRELAALDATGQLVLQLPPPRGLKVLVLSAQQPMKERSELADDANSKRAALASLYPGATQVWVDSGHAIPLEKPQAVVSAIREALKPSAHNSAAHD